MCSTIRENRAASAVKCEDATPKTKVLTEGKPLETTLRNSELFTAFATFR